jgi:hypothetical protein
MFVGSITIPPFVISGYLNNYSISGAIEIPTLVVHGHASVSILMSGDIDIPRRIVSGILSVRPDLNAAIVVPTLVVEGFLRVGVYSPALKAVVVNIVTGAVSEYASFAANSLAYFNGVYIGADSTGLFILTGDKDDTDDIDANLQYPPVDIDLSRPRYVWLTGRVDGVLSVHVEVDEHVEFNNEFQYRDRDDLHEIRTTLAKGLKGRYYSFGIRNKDGADFDIDKIRVLADQLKRPR